MLTRDDNLSHPTSRDLTWNFLGNPISIFIIHYKKKIHIYVKLISPAVQALFLSVILSTIFLLETFLLSSRLLPPFPDPWFTGGCSLQLNIQMFLICNERVEWSGYIEEGWAPSPLVGMKQGSRIRGPWSTKEKHETLLSDPQFATHKGAKNANKSSFASLACTLWKFHSLPSFGFVFSLIMNLNNFLFCIEL